MGKFIVKSLIIMLCVVFVVTFSKDYNREKNNQTVIADQSILMHSADLYVGEPLSEPIEPNQPSDQESVTFQIAQWIEKSGLLIYEGIITIVTDLASVI